MKKAEPGPFLVFFPQVFLVLSFDSTYLPDPL